MDEVSLYNRALSAAEIQSIFYAASDGKCLPEGPVIIQQPVSLTLAAGSTANFQVGITGVAPISYQWRFNDSVLVGQTNSTLVLPNVQPGKSGAYSAVAANHFGSVTSQVATLTVIVPPTLVRVVSTNAASGGVAAVAIELTARGQENALGFSLLVQPTQLSLIDVSLSRSAPSEATLVTNAKDAGQGRVGVLVALPTGATFPAGTQALVVVRYQVAFLASADGLPIGFGDQPTLRQVSDVQAHPLPALYRGGSVRVERSVLEGDVAPRPGGDHLLSTIDWVQLGRFVAALDEVSPEEFQRADCAPRYTLGDGVISVTDWVQAGLYAAGIDQLTPAGGPTAPIAPVKSASVQTTTARLLSLPNTDVAQASHFTLPLRLESQGDENALGFSLKFDPTKIAFVSASKASVASGVILNVNTNQIASGTLGLALALPTGSSFTSGSQQIVLLTFSALATAPASTVVSFADAPVLRQVSDTRANVLLCDYTSATVSVSVVTPGPPLSVARSGQNVVIFWDAASTGFELQTASSLGGTWSKVGVTPVQIGGQNIVTLPLGTSEFFRLSKP
jgi:hypothetical protein